MMWLERIKRSEFLRHVLTLVSGTAMAQAITIVMAPIIARIYLPAEYGLLGVYLSISGVLATLATLQFSHAILLPKEDKESNQVFYLCIINVLITTILVLIAMLFLGKILAQWLNTPEVGKWLKFIPLSVLFSGVTSSMVIWANRFKKYKRISISRIIAAIFTVTSSLIIGILVDGPNGLIIGLLVGQGVGMIFLTYNTFMFDRDKFNPINKQLIKEVIRKYKKFPIYSLPSEFINRISNQLPTLLFTTFYGASAVGLFNMSNRMLGLPSTFISQAVSEVFRQRASQDYNQLGNCRSILMKTLKTLLSLSVVPFVVIALFAPYIFAFVFGEPWREAGNYARILSFMYLMKFSISPLSYVIYIANKQNYGLLMDIYVAISNFTLLYFALNYLNSVYWALGLYSANYGFLYLITFWISYKYSKQPDEDINIKLSKKYH